MLRSASVSRFRASPLAGVFSGAEGIVSPLQLPGAEAWYDVSDLSSMRNDAGAIPSNGEGVKLISDKSGNSGVSVYVSNTAASNNVTSPNKSVTGNQTITLDLSMEDFTPAADRTVISKLSGNNGFEVLVLTTGVVRLRIGDGASVTNVDSTAANTLTNFTRGTLGIVWTDGVGASFTQNGAALGTAVAAVKTLTNAAVVCTIGNFVGTFWRVQVGSVYDCDPSQSASKRINNGDTFTSGGDTWTLVSAGATGGRITGARDLFQGTAANQPILTIAAGGNYLTFDGSNDYLKAAAFALAQPETVYFVGSQVTWTDSDTLFDGNSVSERMFLAQAPAGASPQLAIYAGSYSSVNSGLATATRGVVTSIFNNASSFIRINRGSATTGTTGTQNGNGFTLGSAFNAGNPANITASEVLVYSTAQNTAQQDAVILYLGRHNGIAV